MCPLPGREQQLALVKGSAFYRLWYETSLKSFGLVPIDQGFGFLKNELK